MFDSDVSYIYGMATAILIMATACAWLWRNQGEDRCDNEFSSLP